MSEDTPIISSRYGKPVYEANPTIPALRSISKTRKIKMGDEKRGLIVDGTSGEIFGAGTAIAYQFEEVDKDRFVKIFVGAIEQAAGMTKAGLSVFQLIYDQMRTNKDKDYVLLSAHDAGIPQRTFQRGLKELVDKGFLYQSTIPGKWWVNVQYMFNGDRIALVKGYQLKGTAHQLDLLQHIEKTV